MWAVSAKMIAMVVPVLQNVGGRPSQEKLASPLLFFRAGFHFFRKEDAMSSHLDYEINKELGECYLFMGDYDKAESYYLKAAGSNGIHPDPYLGLATIAVHRGDLERALHLYERAESIASSDKSLTGIGLIAMEQGDLERAHEAYSKALGINPENLYALFGLVQTAHRLNRTADAVEYLQRYLEADPAKVEVRYSLAGCLVACGRSAEAQEQLRHILDQDPSYAPALELLAQLV
jgi:tetratricopeptide (TPR) repeat protein